MTANEVERLAWDAFCLHQVECPVCEDLGNSMCPEGERLRIVWSRADAICARRDQEGEPDLDDCADDALPWKPELP